MLQSYLLIDGKDGKSTLFLPTREAIDGDSADKVGFEEAGMVKERLLFDEVRPCDELTASLAKIATLYLPFAELEGGGVTRFLAKGCAGEREKEEWDGVEPRHKAILRKLNELFPSMKVEDAHAPWIVQPFVPSIWKKGELSVIILGGEVSHGIRKLPKDGDIRVQREHGGREMVETPSVDACEVAMAILRACPGEPMYARADLVEREGRLELMEMELFEPELFFALVPEAADRLAKLL